MPWEEWLAQEQARKEAERAEQERIAAEEKAAKEANASQTEEEDVENDNEEEDAGNEDDAENTEEKEVPPEPPQTKTKYIVCLDTLGTANIYKPESITWITDTLKHLEKILEQIDLKEYLAQRQFNDNILTMIEAYKSSEEDRTKQIEGMY